MNFDWTKLVGDLKDQFLDAGKDLLEGAKADLEAYGRAIAEDLVRAAREGREDIIAELGHQTQALGESNRIRAVNAAWDQVTRIVTTIGLTALKVVAAAAI